MAAELYQHMPDEMNTVDFLDRAEKIVVNKSEHIIKAVQQMCGDCVIKGVENG